MDGVKLTLPGQTYHGQTGSLEMTVLFNRAGAVGGEVRYRFLSPTGAVVANSTRPLADRIQPQAGVIFGNEEKEGRAR